jgi:cytochrome c peroxidase
MRILKFSLLCLCLLPFLAGAPPLLHLFHVSGQPPRLNPPPAPPGNPVTTAKANLGKALFWDEQLSSTNTVACGTCHVAKNGGADPRSASKAAQSVNAGLDGAFGTADDVIGSMGVPLNLADGTYQWSANFGFKEQVTGRRSMSVINAAYAPSLFWDGRATNVFRDPLTNEVLLNGGAALESQILGPPVNDTEMGHTGRDWNDVARRVTAAKPLLLAPFVPAALTTWIAGRNYPSLFAEAFGSVEVTPARIAMAIATYERTLFSNQAPIDGGPGALTAAEARGQQLFGQNGCAACHGGPQFSDNQFHNTGIRPAAEDQGLFAVTGNPNDRAKFRSPSLRNVELRAPYMHNGRFATLEEVVEFYNRGGDFPAANIERNLIRPRNLTAQQKADLVAFLKRPLTDPRVAAETAPFDRPMLYSESARVPRVTGVGTIGTGGLVPQVTALAPPFVGNTNFTVAVSNALGGTQAVLVIDRADPGVAAIPATASLARVPVILSGTGAGNGRGSVSLTIPNNAALVGTTLFGRWFVSDANAANGIAVSQAFQMTVFGTATSTAPAVASVSAASYAMGAVAPESIVSGFGSNLATQTMAANATPLPETLGGVTVTVRDVLGRERPAPLFYVSPTQINYQVPNGTAVGEGTVTVRQNGTIVASGLLQVGSISPSLFSADATGRGAAAAQCVRVKADGSQSTESVTMYDAAQGRLVTKPIDLGASTDQVFLVLFGSGIRGRSGLANATATIGGATVAVDYAGAQGQYIGLDQVNVKLPRTLIGRGEIDVTLMIDGMPSNTVRINIQ